MSYPSMEQLLSPCERIARVLNSLGETSKEIGRKLFYSPFTVKNWKRGSNTMSALALMRAMTVYDEVFNEVCSIVGREPGAMTADQLAAEITRRLKATR